jgi:hypothetical protein
MRQVQIDPETVQRAAKAELCRNLGKLVPVAEFLAKRAMGKGIYLAVSYDRALFDNSARVTVQFRLQRSDLDEKTTIKYLRGRARTIEKFLDVVKNDLADEGIHCEVKKWTHLGPGPEVTIATVVADVTITKVDVEKIFSRPNLRLYFLHATNMFVGGKRSALIKQLEAEAGWEVERGVEDSGVEEAVGAASEGGGEEAAHDTGLIAISHREAVERGCIKLHQAVLRYGVPLIVLTRLAMEGRIRAYNGIDERGKPAFYVVEEDVKEVAKYIRIVESKESGGGEDGG